MTEEEITKFNFLTKWFLPDEEREQRKKVIADVQANCIKDGIATSGFFEQRFYKLLIQYILHIRPITDEMAVDFIFGFCYCHYTEKSEEGWQLIDPTLIIIVDYQNSPELKNELIDKNIHEQMAITTEGITYNARDLLKEYFKDKHVFPLKQFRESRDKLLIEVRNNKEQILKQIDRELKGINTLTGLKCNLHPDTVKEIFNLMVNKQISGNLNDFKAIFANTPTPVKNPVEWLILHNRKPNKTALFTFIKMMLELDELPREILRQANNLFISGKENIFPENYTK